MKTIVFYALYFLFLIIFNFSCSTDNKENTTEQNSNFKWINDTQGYFVDNRDGKEYKIVKIGTQTWFAENLAFKPESGNFWAYDNKDENTKKYGYLYDWETAINVCPPGWHLPGIDEWNKLIGFLGGDSLAGSKLKSKEGWNSSNQEATNSSGFSALPGGNRAVGGSFYHLGEDALFWTSTPADSNMAWKIRIFHINSSVEIQDAAKISGRSVRCVKD